MSSSKVEQTVASFETESEPTNDSTELDQAIGDVFKQIINEDSSDTTKASPAPESVGDDDNMDLDAVIGDAFKSVLPTELPSKDKSLPLPPDDDDNDLENAIEKHLSLFLISKERIENRKNKLTMTNLMR